MFESTAVWILSKFLSEYVKNFDAKALQLDLMKGKVELKHLLLRESLLERMDLPFRVMYGELGSLSISLSWSGLLSKPLIVTITDVYLLAQPAGDVPFDVLADAAQKADIKKKLLAAFDPVQSKGVEAEGDTDSVFSNKTLFRIINNLQITIERIHIRYEDTQCSTTKAPFAFGVLLPQLTAVSATDDWQLCDVGQDPQRCHKRLQLSGLAVYWDTNLRPDGIASRVSTDAAAAARWFRSSFKAYPYLIEPIQATGKLTINKIAEQDTPRYFSDLTFTSLKITLHDEQYIAILGFAEYYTYLTRRALFRQWRPAVALKDNAQQWWRFAISAVLATYRRQHTRWSWDDLKQRRDRRQQYIQLYASLILGQGDTKVAVHQLSLLEQDLTVEDIIFWRKLAAVRTPKPKKTGFFQGWFSLPSATVGLDTPSLEASRKELAKLLEQDTGFAENKDKSFVSFMGHVHVEAVAVELIKNATGRPLLFLALQDQYVHTRYRPNASAIWVRSALQSVSWKMCRPSGELRECVRALTTEAKQPLFEMTAETNPLPKTDTSLAPDSRVLVSLRPVEVYLPVAAINNVIEFFIVPQLAHANLGELVEGALDQARVQSRLSLQYAIENRRNVDAHIDIRAPLFVVPQADDDNPSTVCLVLDLGNLRATSRLHSEWDDSKLKDLDAKALENLAYDKYDVALSDLKLVLSTRGVYRDAVQDRQSSLRLLDEVSAQLTVERCLRPRDPFLPNYRVSGTLPALCFNLDACQLNQLMLLGQSLSNDFGALQQSSTSSDIAKEEKGSLSRLLSTQEQSRPSLRQLSTELESVDSETERFYDAPEAPLDLTVLEADYKARKLERRTAEAQNKVLQWQVSILSVTVNLRAYDPLFEDDRTFLCLGLYNFGSEGVMRLFDLVTQVRLSGLYLEHFLPGKIPTSSFLLHTASARTLNSGENILHNMQACEDHFIDVNVRTSTASSPVLATEFNNNLNTIELVCAAMTVVADRDTLANVVVMLSAYLKIVAATPSSASTQASPMQRFTSAQSGTAAGAQARSARPAAVSISSTLGEQPIKLVLRCRLDAFHVQLQEAGQRFAELDVTSLAATIKQQEDNLALHARLSGITCRDLTMAHTLYETVLCVQPGGHKHLIDVNLKLLFAPERECDAQLQVSVAQLRYIYLHKFTTLLLDYAASLQAPLQQLQITYEKAVPTASQKFHRGFVEHFWDHRRSGNPAAPPYRFLLSAEVLAPYIVLPEHSDSTIAFSIDLGEVHLSNAYVINNETVDNVFDMAVRQVALSRGVCSVENGFQVFHPLFELPSIKCILTLCGESAGNALETPPVTQVQLQLHLIELTLSHQDLSMLMRTVQGNFAEQSTMLSPQQQPAQANIAALPQEREGSSTRHLDEPSSAGFRFEFDCRQLVLNVVELSVVETEESRSQLLCRLQLDDLGVDVLRAPMSHQEFAVSCHVLSGRIDDRRRTTTENLPCIFVSTCPDTVNTLQVTISTQRSTVRCIPSATSTLEEVKEGFSRFGELRCLFEELETEQHYRAYLIDYQDPGRASAAVAYFHVEASSEELIKFIVVDMGPSCTVAGTVEIQPAELTFSATFLLQLQQFLDIKTSATPVSAAPAQAAGAIAATASPGLELVCLLSGQPVDVFAQQLTEFKVWLEQQRVIVLGNAIDPNCRGLILEITGVLRYRQLEETQALEADLSRLVIFSCQMQERDIVLYIMPVCSLTLAHIIKDKWTTSTLISAEAIAFNLSLRDIVLIRDLTGRLTGGPGCESITNGVAGEWTQAVTLLHSSTGGEPASAPQKPLSDHQQQQQQQLWEEEPAKMGRRDHLQLDVNHINITFIDNSDGHQAPLLLMSSSLVVTFENWLMDHKGLVVLELAAACYNRERTVWEPLLLGPPDERDRPRQLTVELCAQQISTAWRLPSKVAASSNDKGLPGNVIDGESDTFWEGQSKGVNWLVFTFDRSVQLSRFRFQPGGDSKYAPSRNTLLVGKKGVFPRQDVDWTVACTFDVGTPDSDTPGLLVSPLFAATGTFWKWEIAERAGGNVGARITEVGFQVSTGGTLVDLTMDVPVELTLSVRALGDQLRFLHAITEMSSEVAAVSTPVLHTHEIRNLTGKQIAVVQGRIFQPNAAQLVQPDGHLPLEYKVENLRPQQQAEDGSTETGPEAAENFELLPPITDIDVVCISKGERPRPGWTAIEKDINRGANAKHAFWIVYTRDPINRPITDLWVVWQGKGGPSEPVPRGFTLINVDLNDGDGRRIFLTFRRGNSLPIVELAVAYLGPRAIEATREHFVSIYKDLNRGRGGSEDVFLSYRLQPPPPGWSLPTPLPVLGAQPPLTDLFFIYDSNAVKMAEEKRSEGWDFRYHGMPVDLSGGHKKVKCILLYRRDPNHPAPITMMRLGHSAQSLGLGWACVAPIPINKGSGTSPRFLFIRRDRGAPPVVDLNFVYDNKLEVSPDWRLCEHALTSSLFGPDLRMAISVADWKPNVVPQSRPAPLIASAVVATDQEDSSQHDTSLTDIKDNGSAQLAKEGMAVAKARAENLVLSWLKASQAAPPEIALEVEGYLPVNGIPVSRIGTEIYTLQPARADQHAVQVAVDVDQVDQVKVVRLSGPGRLINALAVPIDICYQRELRDETVLATLQPGEEYHMPVGLAEDEIAQQPAFLPLHRFWDVTTRKHFYCTDPTDTGEKNGHSWFPQGPVGYILQAAEPGTVPLWANAANDTRNYVFTNRIQEVQPDHPRQNPRTDEQLLRQGMRKLGYVYPNGGTPRTLPLYNYCNSEFRDHLLTIDPTEVGVTRARERGAHRYLLDGTECYVLEHYGQWRIRPAGDLQTEHAFKWSREHVHHYCSRQPSFRALRCAPARGSDTLGFMALMSAPPTHPLRWRVEAPLEVANALPFDIQVAIGQRADFSPTYGQVLTLQADSQQPLSLLDYDRLIFLRLSFDINGAIGDADRWTTAACIYKPSGDSGDSGSFRPGQEELVHCWQQDGQPRQIVLKLHYSRSSLSSTGALLVNIYSTYVVKNETATRLNLHDTQSRFWLFRPVHAPIQHKLALFSPPGKTDHKAILSYGQGRSTDLLRGDPIALEVLQAQLVLMRDPSKKVAAQLSSTWKWGSSAHLWFEVTILPTVAFYNGTKGVIEFSQAVAKDLHQASQPLTYVVAPGETVPVCTVLERDVWSCRFPDITEWSSSFGITTLQTITVKMEDVHGALVTLQVDCSKNGLQYMVRFLPAAVGPPLQFENYCVEHTMNFSQLGCSDVYLLPPGHQMGYSLDDPAVADPMLAVTVENTECKPVEISLFPKEPMFLKFVPHSTAARAENKQGVVAVVVFKRGDTRVIAFADSVPQLRQCQGLPAVLQQETLIVDICVRIPAVGISLIDFVDDMPREVTYIYFLNVMATLNDTSHFRKLSFLVERLQIDNSLSFAKFPVALTVDASVPSNVPWLSGARVLRKGEIGIGRGYDSETYCSVALQAMDIKADTAIVKALCSLVSAIDLPVTTSYQTGEPFLFELIELHPIKLYITFTMHDSGEELDSGNPLLVLSRSTGVALGSINRWPISLSSLKLVDQLKTAAELQADITQMYKKKVFTFLKSRGILGAIASLDVLGNPESAFTNIRGGFEDLFYEPAKAVVHRPSSFGRTFAFGAQSFSRSIVGSLTGAASKITGALGSGIAVLGMDKDYQKARQRAATQHGQSLGGGFISGLHQFGLGVRYGVSGLWERPINGAKEKGGLGMLTGVGQGLIGLVTKPVGGAVDLISSSLGGVETAVSGVKDAERARHSRYIGPQGVITPYSQIKSYGAHFMRHFEEEFEQMIYMYHVTEPLSNDSIQTTFIMDKVVLVLLSQKSSIKIKMQLDSELIAACCSVEGGVQLTMQDSGIIVIKSNNEQCKALLLEGLQAVIRLYQTSRIWRQRQAMAHMLKKQQTYFKNQALGSASTQCDKAAAAPKQTKTAEIWENQRRYPFTGWSSRLLPTDPQPWSSRDMTIGYSSQDAVPISPDFHWTDRWHLDLSIGGTDGWQYAFNFPHTFSDSRDKLLHNVRRRRWVREQVAV